MKNLVRTVAASMLIITSCLSTQAKSRTLDGFISKVSSSLVSFDYSFSCQVKKSKMTGEGSVKLQDDAFMVKGNGLDIYCDGKSRWTVDTASEEAIIESVDGSGDSYTTNPALLITAVDDAFNETSFGSSKFSGKTVDASTLSPIKAGKSSSDISQLKLFFKSGSDELVGAQVKLNDGSVTDFVIKDFRFSAKLKGKESFRIDEKTLGKSYVITDLR